MTKANFHNKILVVDDEAIYLQNICYFLSKEGYTVEHANSGGEAIKKLRDNFFHLVLTDYEMGDTDGLKVLEEAKRLNPHSEVIIITGNTMFGPAEKLKAKKAYQVILKPIKLDFIKKIVHSALEKVHSSNISKSSF